MLKFKKMLATILSIGIILCNAALFANAATDSTVSPLLPSGDSPKIYVNFDDETADNLITDGWSDGAIVGNPDFVESFNGTKALKITNKFGKAAQQYVKFNNVAFGAESFTVSLWYQATNSGGNGLYSNCGSDAWTGFENFDYSQGGTIFSNTGVSNTGVTGLSVLNLPRELYATYTISDGTTTYTESNMWSRGTLKNIEDSRWHNLTVTVDRKAGNAIFYVDAVATKTQSISNFTGTLENVGTALIFGADILGNYGVMSANYDEIAVYDYALSVAQVTEGYTVNNLGKLINNVKTSILEARIGSRFTADAINEMIKTVETANTAYTTVGADHEAAYNALNTAYEEFLMGNKPNQVTIFTSDTHLGKSKDVNRTDFLNILDAASSLPYPANTLINAGDYDENRIDYGDGEFFQIIEDSFLNSVEGANVAVCTGNHQ